MKFRLKQYHRFILCNQFEEAYQLWLSFNVLEHLACILWMFFMSGMESRTAHAKYLDWEHVRLKERN